MENTHVVFANICEMLNNNTKYRVQIDEEKHTVHLGVNTRVGLINFIICVQEELSLLSMLIILPLRVPEKMRSKVGELIVRANDGWLLGHLSLSISSGLISWHVGMPIEDGNITGKQFEGLLIAGISMTDRYISAINRLIYSDDLSPAEAIAEVEMADD